MNPVFDRVAHLTLNTDISDMPQEAMDWAALLLLDTLGIAIASAPMDAGVIARNTAHLLYGSGEAQTAARMLLDGRKVSLAGAAYAIATQTDNLDAHDGYNPVKGHIGCAVVPALLAFSETQKVTGPEALSALVVGYEIAGRAGKALHGTVSDYHTSGAWNALGVVATGARLRGVSEEVFRQALGIAEYHGPRSQMMREIANPTMLHDGSGWGAMAGVSALVLAEQGFTGAPAITIEEAPEYWGDLGAHWLITEQYIKPYPICRWAHAPIDAARRLMLDHGFSHDDITKVVINTFDESACLFGGMPETTSQAQYSLAFAVGHMLVSGQIGVAQISGEGLSDPSVAALIAKSVVQTSDEHNALFPAHRTADVEITLKDGRVVSSGLTHARGGAEEPFGAADVQAKFMEFAVPVVGERRGAAIVEAVLTLAQDGSSFDRLAKYLYDPA